MSTMFRLSWIRDLLTLTELENLINALRRDHSEAQHQIESVRQNLHLLVDARRNIQADIDSENGTFQVLADLYRHRHFEFRDAYHDFEQQSASLRRELRRIEEAFDRKEREYEWAKTNEEKIRNRVRLAGDAYREHMERREQSRHHSSAGRENERQPRPFAYSSNQRQQTQDNDGNRRTDDRRRPFEQAQPSRPEPSRSTTTPLDVESWYRTVNASFADYSKMTRFPKPPAWDCGKASCKTQDRKLAACACNIRWLFRDVDVKKERLRWHPNRFCTCPEAVREEFQKLAQEVFVVLDEMYQKGKDGGK